MKEFLKSLKPGLLLTGILSIVLGVVLIANPGIIQSALRFVLGGGLALFGLLEVVSVFVRPNGLMSVGRMVPGILCLAVGLVFIFRFDTFVALLWILIGIAILIDAVYKLQYAFALKAAKEKNWWINLLISLATMIFAVVLMIELYRGVSRNPTVSWYAADVFAMAAVILVFFAVAGDAVGRTGPAKVVATAFAAVSLGLCAAVGRAVRLASDLISGGSPADLVCAESFQLLLFAGAVLFAVGAAKAVVRRGVRMPGEEQEN